MGLRFDLLEEQSFLRAVFDSLLATRFDIPDR
jgi:hypothetical protein